MALAATARREFTGQDVAFAEFLAREATALIDGEAPSPSEHGLPAAPGARPATTDLAAAGGATGDRGGGLPARVTQLDELAERLAAVTPQSEAELLARATLDALAALPGLRSCTLYRVHDGLLTPVVWPGGGAHVAPPPLRLDDLPAAAEALAAGAAMAPPEALCSRLRQAFRRPRPARRCTGRSPAPAHRPCWRSWPPPAPSRRSTV